jgi:hypothetical protein
MLKRLGLTLAALLLVGLAVFGVALGTGAEVAPAPITTDSACPATRCASGECHGYGNVPQPDGVHELVCPDRGCSSVECHGWDKIASGHHKASDESLNLWILVPSLLIGCLVLLAWRF